MSGNRGGNIKVHVNVDPRSRASNASVAASGTGSRTGGTSGNTAAILAGMSTRSQQSFANAAARQGIAHPAAGSSRVSHRSSSQRPSASSLSAVNEGFGRSSERGSSRAPSRHRSMESILRASTGSTANNQLVVADRSRQSGSRGHSSHRSHSVSRDDRGRSYGRSDGRHRRSSSRASSRHGSTSQQVAAAPVVHNHTHNITVQNPQPVVEEHVSLHVVEVNTWPSRCYRRRHRSYCGHPFWGPWYDDWSDDDW